MKYTVLTLFPEMIEQGMGTSITGRAMSKGLIELKAVNIVLENLSLNGTS